MRSTAGLEALLTAAACALLSSLALTSCTGPLEAPLAAAHPDDASPRRGGTLRLATFGDVATLDPAVAGDQLSLSVARLIYAGLVDFAPDGHLVPDLAAQIDETDEGRTYRFTLREGVHFHDGSELTASDVKRSIERALHPDTPSPTASLYDGIDGYAAFTERRAPHLEGVVVEGRYVVTIHLRDRDARFLPALALAGLRVTCPGAGDHYDPAWAPCGAGPFRLAPGGWEHGANLTLVRHDGYFRPGLPYLDAVSWELGATLIAQGFKFARGDLDAVRDLTQASVIRYLADPRWQPFGEYEPAREVRGDAMNVEMPPFDNVEVRRAVSAAVDRDHMALLRATSLSPAYKPVPVGMPGYDPPPDVGQRHDLASALDHMRKAGLAFDPATGRGGWPAPIPYDVYKQAGSEQTGQLLQQDLAKIGLHVELRISSFPSYLALTHRRGKSAMSAQGWTEDYPDPSNFLEPVFGSKAIRDEDSTNYSFYSNPALDALLERAQREADPAARTRLYAEAERIVCDDAPWVFEYAVRLYLLHQGYVRGLRAHAVWLNDVEPVWLDRARERYAAGAESSLPGALARSLLGGRP